MKLLIYGFKPYKKWKQNISEKILRKIRRRGIVKIVFPVSFEKKTFVNRIKKLNPDIILGLGQYPGGKKIRIERKAVNLKRHTKKEKPKISFKNKPEYNFVNLKLKKDKNSWISYNAGEYVCNFSMYVISDCYKKKNIKFAFIHFPYNYNLDKAVKFVENKLDSFTPP
nr:hypothetical protein [Nanoarchaeota archaeon]